MGVKFKCSFGLNSHALCVRWDFCAAHFRTYKLNLRVIMIIREAHRINFRIAPQEIRVLLSRIVEQYNFIHGKTEKCEFDIVFDQVRAIDADAAILVDEFTWQNFGNWNGTRRTTLK